jgi:hypothetical protein
MEVGRPMEDEQAAQEHPATAQPQLAAERPATADPEIAATGEPRVDAALAGLGQLALLPVGEHAAVFEQVHRGLREVLGELDGGPAGSTGDSSGPAGRPGR